MKSILSALFLFLAAPSSSGAQSGPTVLATEQVKLLADDRTEEDFLGTSVALSGDTAVVGAYGHEHGSPGCDLPFDPCNTGAAYVFVRSGSAWSQQAELVPSDSVDDSFFGVSVAISGDTILVGADHAHNGSTTSGAAYVFVRSGSNWTQEAKLVANDGAALDYFGAVALDGNLAAIGAPGAGAAYTFTRSGTAWTQSAKLVSDDAALGDGFGTSVAVDGSTVLVGAPAADVTFSLAGTAYVFTAGGLQVAKLVVNDPAQFAYVGQWVSLSGDTALLSANPWGGCSPCPTPAAYVFVRSGSSWSQQTKLLSSVPGRVGKGVSVSGDRAVIGADSDGMGPVRQGAAIVYCRSGSTWSEEAVLTASDGAAGDEFGFSVSLENDTVLFGALFDDGSRGSAYAVTLFDESASVATRNAGPNPASYTADAAVLGSTWTASVDLTTTGHSLARIYGYGAANSVTLARGQVVLVGGARYFSLPAQSGPVAIFGGLIPSDPAIAGLTVYTQAIHFGGVAPFALTNSQDLFLGL